MSSAVPLSYNYIVGVMIGYIRSISNILTYPGNVEARVMCFYRRNEVPLSLVPLADKHHWGEVDVQPVKCRYKNYD